MRENWIFSMFHFTFYESLVCDFGETVGGDISTGASIDGEETWCRGWWAVAV
jgi:hypothetical protein